VRRFLCAAFLLVLMCSLLLPANAADTQNGSVEISVRYQDTAVTGGDLIAVRVGYVDSEENVFRRFITNAEITGIGEAGTVTELQNFYTAYKQIHQFDEFKTVITDGVGWFTDIPQGLYLIYQKTAAPGYQKLPAFLVTVPFKDELDVTVVSKPELELDAVPETTGPEPTEGDKDDDKDEEKLPQTGQLTVKLFIEELSVNSTGHGETTGLCQFYIEFLNELVCVGFGYPQHRSYFVCTHENLSCHRQISPFF